MLPSCPYQLASPRDFTSHIPKGNLVNMYQVWHCIVSHAAVDVGIALLEFYAGRGFLFLEQV